MRSVVKRMSSSVGCVERVRVRVVKGNRKKREKGKKKKNQKKEGNRLPICEIPLRGQAGVVGLVSGVTDSGLICY
jgi:hypothetical protein